MGLHFRAVWEEGVRAALSGLLRLVPPAGTYVMVELPDTVCGAASCYFSSPIVLCSSSMGMDRCS